MRPCLCYICGAAATVVDQRRRAVVVIGRTGDRRRDVEWVGRYLCGAHEHCDPWDGTTAGVS